MPKTESPQPKEGGRVEEKPKARTKRLTAKTVLSEVDILKQGVAGLDAKVMALSQTLEGLGSKIEAPRSPLSDAQGAQQMAVLSSGFQSLNGNYLRQVDELANVRRSLIETGDKVDTLTASIKLVEESCGEISIEVDGLKEHIDKASKKVESMEVALGKLEKDLKRGYWMAGVVVGAIAIIVVVMALVLL
jgi:predicted  nucleic acid-binding Zn-ribbon protein